MLHIDGIHYLQYENHMCAASTGTFYEVDVAISKGAPASPVIRNGSARDTIIICPNGNPMLV